MPIQLAFMGTNYNFYSSTAPVFVPQASYPVSASGGTVPAWTGTILFPGAIQSLTPQLINGNPLTVDATMDFALAWSGPAVTNVALELVYVNAAGTATLVCSFDGTMQKGVVPSSRLKAFKSLAGSQLATMTVLSFEQSFLPVGGWSIDLEGVDMAGIAQVTLQ